MLIYFFKINNVFIKYSGIQRLRENPQQIPIIRPKVNEPPIIPLVQRHMQNTEPIRDEFQGRRSEIYDLICDNIGFKWRDLGRKLNIQEGQLENIEMTYRDCNTKVHMIFELAAKIRPNESFLNRLLVALEGSRRLDLARKIRGRLNIQ